MLTIYVDFPADSAAYNFQPGDETGEQALAREFEHPVKFICNCAAGLSDGDVYEITFETEHEVTAFILKTGCTLLEKTRIDDYRHRRYYLDNHYEKYMVKS